MKKNKAFSLIELLISIIVISLITTAFAPIITKKVKANLLVLNGGGSNTQTPDIPSGGGGDDNPPDNNDEEPEYLDPACVDGPNETCCKNLNSLYISSATHPGYTGQPICMTKYNVGDSLFKIANGYYKPPFAAFGVQAIYPYQAGSHDAVCVMTEANKNTCCWKGTTSTTAATVGFNVHKTNPDTYGGSERTVCQKEAAELLCENWTHNGSYKGSWRLPSTTEMNLIAAYIAKDTATETPATHKNLSKWAGDGGLQLCEYNANIKTVKNKIYQSANYCPNAGTCKGASNNACQPSLIWSDNQPYRLNNGVFTATGVTNKMTAGVRCVTEHPGRRIKEPPKHTATGTEPKNQEDCSKYGALFIPAKYTGGSKNLCVLQTSVEPLVNGGKYEFDYGLSGVALLPDKAKCTQTDGSCCWADSTGTSNGVWNYPGAQRGVCQYEAAKKLCESYVPTNDGIEKKGKWRLPTDNELKNLAMYLMASSEHSPFISKYLNDGATGGIQLCDSTSHLFGSNSCKQTARCLGASNSGACMPFAIWSSTSKGTGYHYAYRLRNGIFEQVGYADKSAIGVRCVTDSLEGDIDKYTPGPNEPTQEKCEQIGMVFLDHKYTKGKNLCMTNFNLNDYSNSELNADFYKSEVTLVPGKTKCNNAASGMCCWEGGGNVTESVWITNPQVSASTGSNAGTYLGTSRTLCQKKAANALCKNWKPVIDGDVYANWRLPTQEELNNLISYFNSGGEKSPGATKYAGDAGLQLCDSGSNAYGMHKCPRARGGYASGASSCSHSSSDDGTTYYQSCPYRIWSQGYPFEFINGNFRMATSDYNENSAAGVRCVIDDLTKGNKDYEEEKYCDNGEIFISKKYTGNKDLCIKQTNFGDDPNYDDYYLTEIPSESVINNYAALGITLAFQNTVCDAAAASSGLCCWYGPQTTLNGLELGTAQYGPNQRTVCQYAAANKLCSNYGAAWRLMTESEMGNFQKAINAEGNKSVFLSRYRSTNGIKLCDNANTKTVYGSDYCPDNTTRCRGAKSNTCSPGLIWNKKGTSSNPGYTLAGGILKPYTISDVKSIAGSVRCVREVY